MTKKHFEALASALADVRPVRLGTVYADSGAVWRQWQDSVNAVARVCARSNPAFDSVRFTQACTDRASSAENAGN